MIAPGLGHGVVAWLLRNSAGAAVVALLVLFAQWLLGRRISARWRHNLWLLVIVRLLLPPLPTVKVPAIPHLALLRPLVRHFHQPTPSVAPVAVIRVEVRTSLVIPSNRVVLEASNPPSPDSRIPLNNTGAVLEGAALAAESIKSLPSGDLREGQAPGVPDLLLQPSPAIDARVAPALKGLRLQPVSRLVQHIEPTRTVSWAQVALGAWIAVALGLGLKTLVASLRVERAVRKLRAVREPALLDLVADCAHLLKLPRAPVLLEGSPESGPALVGFWRPKLLLPACVLDQFTWRELRHIVLHELVHLRRRDILVNYLTSLALAVHWFNPLAWLAAARLRAERELACDEAVLALTPWREGRAYGSTIVKLLELLSRGAVPAGAMGVLGHKALMHRRIAMIARFDGSRRHWSASAILLSAAVAGAALAGAVRAQVQPEQQAVATSAASDQSAQRQAQSADSAPQDGKPEAAPDEASAQQAIRAEAGRDEPTPPAAEVPTPPPGGAAPAAAEPPPPAPAPGELAPSGNDVSVPTVPTPALRPGDVTQGTPGPAPSGMMDPRAVFGYGRGGGMMPGMNPGGGFGGAPGNVGQPQIATIEDAAAVKADMKTVDKLQRTMPLQVQGESFEDVLNSLAQKGGFDIVIDNRALGQVQLVPVQMNIREPQPIEQLLQLLLRQAGGDEIGFSVVHGVVMVSSKAELDRHVVTRVYDIRDTGSQDDIQQTIDQTIGGRTAIRFLNGKLIVTTSEPSQREIAKLLAMLRQDGPRAEATGGPPVEWSGQAVVFQLKHANAEQASRDLQLKLGPGAKAVADPRTNSLIITGSPDAIHRASLVIERLDGKRDEIEGGSIVIDGAGRINSGQLPTNPQQGGAPQPAAR